MIPRPVSLAACGVFAIVCFVFVNSLSNSFVWDDEQFIQRNAYLTSIRRLPRLLTQPIGGGAGVRSNIYRPLQSLTHFLDVRLWGYRPWGHHLTNLLLHAGAMTALFLWLASFAPTVGALFGALLYGLHPMQSEAVAYVSGRGDSLAILFLCAGLLLFRRHRLGSLACALLAMASKESLALFPVFLWLSERAQASRIVWRRHLPFWVLSGFYILLRLTALNFSNTLNFYGTGNLLTRHPEYRFFTYLTTLPEGLRLWLWPVDLHHERSWSVLTSLAFPRACFSAIAVAGWIAVAAWAWRRHRALAVGMLWCLAATIPTSNLFVLINALFYDHWFLLPGIGLAIIVSQLPIFKTSLRPAAIGVCLLLAAALARSARQQNLVWRSPASLNSHILRYEPRNAKILNNLGMALIDEGKTEAAAAFYRRAIALSDTYPQTHHNLAKVYEAQGRFAEAEAEFRKAIAISPGFYHSWTALGLLQLSRGDAAAAETSFRKALEAYPYAVEAYLELAEIKRRAEDHAGALAELQRGLAVVDDPRLRSALRRLESSSP